MQRISQIAHGLGSRIWLNELVGVGMYLLELQLGLDADIGVGLQGGLEEVVQCLDVHGRRPLMNGERVKEEKGENEGKKR